MPGDRPATSDRPADRLPSGDRSGDRPGAPDAALDEQGFLADRGRNALLARLPADEDQRLMPKLAPVELGVRQQVETQGTALEAVYFPVNCVLSIVDSVDTDAGTDGVEEVVPGLVDVEVAVPRLRPAVG